MRLMLLICINLMVLMSISGCATKTYGRQGSLTDFEKNTLTCRELDLEIARTSGFVDHVNKESEFSGRDVLAIMGDFGIGNSMERTAAIESANARIDQLQALKERRGCGTIAAQKLEPAAPPMQSGGVGRPPDAQPRQLRDSSADTPKPFDRAMVIPRPQ